MNMYLAEFSFKVQGCESDESFESHLDQVLDFLSDDDRIVDPDYTAALANRVVEFSLSVEAEDEATAFPILHGSLRAAIHAAEGCTPGWENHFHQVQMLLRQAELVDA